MPTLNGNSLTCEEILDRYGPLVYRMAIQGTGSVADGEDVAQEVFVSLIQCDPRFADETHLKAWLIRATANRCKSWGRSPWHRRTSSPEGRGAFAQIRSAKRRSTSPSR